MVGKVGHYNRVDVKEKQDMEMEKKKKEVMKYEKCGNTCREEKIQDNKF